MTTTATTNERQSLIYAVSQALAYMHKGLDFSAIDCRNGEAMVIVEPRTISQSQKRFVAGVCLLSDLGWRQERFGDEEGVADMVRSWRADVDYVSENGFEGDEPSSLFDTFGELPIAANTGLAFMATNRELIDEAADFVDASARYVEYESFAGRFNDRLGDSSVGSLAMAVAAFEPHDHEIRELAAKIKQVLAEEERAS